MGRWKEKSKIKGIHWNRLREWGGGQRAPSDEAVGCALENVGSLGSTCNSIYATKPWGSLNFDHNI